MHNSSILASRIEKGRLDKNRERKIGQKVKLWTIYFGKMVEIENVPLRLMAFFGTLGNTKFGERSFRRNLWPSQIQPPRQIYIDRITSGCKT